MGEVGFGEVRALFEDHHAESVFRQFLGDDAARRSRAHDDEIDLFGGFVFGLLGGHDLALSEGLGGCQPG